MENTPITSQESVGDYEPIGRQIPEGAPVHHIPNDWIPEYLKDNFTSHTNEQQGDK